MDPPPDTLFYYLVSPGNSCRESILGRDGTDADGEAELRKRAVTQTGPGRGVSNLFMDTPLAVHRPAGTQAKDAVANTWPFPSRASTLQGPVL